MELKEVHFWEEYVKLSRNINSNKKIIDVFTQLIACMGYGTCHNFPSSALEFVIVMISNNKAIFKSKLKSLFGALDKIFLVLLQQYFSTNETNLR